MPIALPDMRHEIPLPRSPDAGLEARRFLEGSLEGRISEEALADAQLVASELANNAYLHGAGRILLRTRLADGSLRIEVVDEGSGQAPQIREQGDECGGWGLALVAGLAREWGAHEGTTHVWAELDVG